MKRIIVMFLNSVQIKLKRMRLKRIENKINKLKMNYEMEVYYEKCLRSDLDFVNKSKNYINDLKNNLQEWGK